MKCLFQIANSELHSFTYSPVDSRMFILIESNKSIVIDPCICDAAFQLLKHKDINDIIIILTHEHYDHISGVNWFKKNFKCQVIASEQCAKNITNPKYNYSAYFETLMDYAIRKSKLKMPEKRFGPYECTADNKFEQYHCFTWQSHKVEIRETPGHSKGSVCIVLDCKYVFTGDSLIKGISTITKLPGGSKAQYEEITLPFLHSLPQSTIIFPGHGEPGHIEEFEF